MHVVGEFCAGCDGGIDKFSLVVEDSMMCPFGPRIVVIVLVQSILSEPPCPFGIMFSLPRAQVLFESKIIVVVGYEKISKGLFPQFPFVFGGPEGVDPWFLSHRGDFLSLECLWVESGSAG